MYKIIFFSVAIIHVIASSVIIFFVFRFIRRITNLNKKHENVPEELRKKLIEKYVKRYLEKVFRKNLQLEQKIDFNTFINPLLKTFLDLIEGLKILYTFPMHILRLILMIFNPVLLWKLPVSFYEIWYLLLIVCSFSLSSNNYTTVAICIASLNASFSLSNIFDYFRPDKKGIMRIVSMPKYKLRIFGIVQDWFLIVLSYGAIYYGIYMRDVKSFSGNINIPDSIYFSFVTITTLGHGDIIPKSFLAKFVVVTEVLFGFTFAVIVLAIFLNVWLQRKIKKKVIQKK